LSRSKTTFNVTFNNNSVFIDAGNWNAWRKPQTWCNPLTKFITICCIEYTSPWAGFELKTLVVKIICSIWAGWLHWVDNLLLYIVTDRNIAFSGYLLSFGNLVHFLLTENIKRGNPGIIIWFFILIQNINVDGLLIRSYDGMS
jgi:hypothetical protein